MRVLNIQIKIDGPTEVREPRRPVVLPLAGGHSGDADLLMTAEADDAEAKDHKKLAMRFAKFVYESTPATFYRELKAAFGHPEQYEEPWR